MGQKINPFGFRLVSTSNHLSNWHSEKTKYTNFVLEDFIFRDEVTTELQSVLVLLQLYIFRLADYTKFFVLVSEPTLEEVYSFFIDFIVWEAFELESVNFNKISGIDEVYFFENINAQKKVEDFVETVDSKSGETHTDNLIGADDFLNVLVDGKIVSPIGDIEPAYATSFDGNVKSISEDSMNCEDFFTAVNSKKLEPEIEPPDIERVTSSQFLEYGYPFLIDLYKKAIVESISSLNTKISIELNILTDDKPSASFVAQFVRHQIRSRVNFRRVVLMCTELYGLGESGGFKLEVSGRLDGIDLARTEWIRKGAIPLQTMLADIDYAQAELKTVAGVIGIKVWIYYK